ncbi:MAG TPA: Uma2 family endonuclease [Pirellulales bacterium]|nr:Uma2 family endonuclease [Pirellulales bacterium]
MSMTLVHHRFTVDEYEQMVECGILSERDRVELIRGEILEKMPIGERHAGCVNHLNSLLAAAVGKRAVVAIQNPVIFPDSQPEPDVALLLPRDDFYKSVKPRPKDVLLVIEVADSTLDFDRDIKGAMYAQSGIQEYWILNLLDNCLEVHRQPQSDGTFRDVRTLPCGHSVEIATLPDVTVAVADVL